MCKEVVLVDFDNCLCLNTKSGLETNNILEGSTPNEDLIKTMQQNAEDFDYVIFTSRGMLSCNGNTELAEKTYYDTLNNWLHKHNVPFSKIQFGKPHCKWIIDDKALSPEEFYCIYAKEDNGQFIWEKKDEDYNESNEIPFDKVNDWLYNRLTAMNEKEY